MNRDQMEAVVDLKTIEGAIVKKFDELSAVNEKARAEIAEIGKANSETLGKLDAITKEYNALYDRVQTIEQKGIKVSDGRFNGLNVGEEFVKSEQFLALQSGSASRARMELKTAIINATGASQPLVAADRLGGINTTPNRFLTIRDILPASTTTSNLVEFTRENAFTNNAAAAVSGSPQQFENVSAPESAITFTLVSAAVSRIWHSLPASRQVLDDSADLAGHINNRMMYGLKLKEETQLLSGTGANGQISGLITQATAFTQTSPLTTNEIDIIRMAIKQAHVAEYRPDFLVLHPSDWFDIETKKVGTADNRYVVGDPSSMMVPRLWGLPVVVTNSISSGTFLLGSSRGAEIKDRQQSAIEMSREEGNNFTKGMVTFLAEERLALCVYRTEAFITGSL